VWRRYFPRHPTVVLTDLEPDDVQALGILARRWPIFDVRTVLVGEGNPTAKVAVARDLLAALQYKDVRVAPGCASTKLFPGEEVLKGNADDAPYDAANALLAALEAAGPAPVLVCLKPPREMQVALAEFPDRAVKVFGRTTLVMYGSFNLRALGYSHTLPLVQDATTPFQRVLLYETHACRGVPNLNPRTVPGLEGWFARWRPAFAALLWQRCRVWDADILRDCIETCASEELEGRRGSPLWARNDKCRAEVEAHAGRQFVPADGVLALMAFNPRFDAYCHPVAITHDGVDGHYPAWKWPVADAARAKVFAWRDVPGDTVVQELQRTL
jgi:hypothetical protein